MSQTQFQHLSSAPKSLKGDDEYFEYDNSLEGKQKRPALKEKTQNIQQKPKLNVSHDEYKITNNVSGKMFNRLTQEAQMYSDHNKQLSEYYSQEAMKECSFTPKLQSTQEQDRRSLYQFLSDQQDHVNRVELKLEQIKLQDKEREDSYFYHPQTNEFNLPNRDQTVPVYERLYNLKKQPKTAVIPETIDSQNSYRPQVNNVSKNMVREENVQDILYKDAQRRNKKMEMNENQKKTKVVAVNMKFTSNNSEKIVAQKFIREFEAIVDWIFDQTGQQRPTNVSFSIDYLKLGEILQKLNFVSIPQTCKNEKAVEFENLRLAEERALLCEVWGTLRGDELGGVSKRNLCLFLLTLIGITEFKIKELPTLASEEPNYQKQSQQNKITNAHQPNDKQKLGKLDRDGNLIFNFEETRKVQRLFDILYRNRLGSEQLKKTTWTDTNSYKPEVLPQSQQLASKYREKLLEETAALIDGDLLKVVIPVNGQITHADLLVLQKKTQEYQLSIKKKQLEEIQLEKCTFHPQLVNKVVGQSQDDDKERGTQKGLQLYQLGKSVTSKRDRTKEEIDYERQQEECTFTPDCTKNLNQSKQSDLNDKSIIARDVDKTVSRMRDARKKREQVQGMLDRGYNNLNRKSQVQLKVKQQQTPDSQLTTFPSQQTNEVVNEIQSPEQERVPLLFVDVNLGPGKTERIIVFEGDHSADLASKFAQDHSLDEFMKDKLKELLDYQISGLLTKIDEEMASVNSDNEN